MTGTKYNPDPRLDLVLERIVDVPRELVWKAWTTPEYLMKWFTPLPWITVECEIDLRPGGIFRTVMRSPDGKDYPNVGCYLEVIENESLVWTDALEQGYRPSNRPNNCIDSFFTAIIMLEPHEGGTKYTVIAIHPDEEGRKRHEERGFHEGWSSALDQLVAFVKTL
ncbi:MAG: SRPBCC family protein [Thermodesulfobacteriota bacterium]